MICATVTYVLSGVTRVYSGPANVLTTLERRRSDSQRRSDSNPICTSIRRRRNHQSAPPHRLLRAGDNKEILRKRHEQVNQSKGPQDSELLQQQSSRKKICAICSGDRRQADIDGILALYNRRIQPVLSNYQTKP